MFNWSMGLSFDVLQARMKPGDRILEAILALDEPHRVERPSIAVMTETINRHDARMFETCGAIGIHVEPRTAIVIVSVMPLNALECHRPLRFLIARDVDLAQATSLVKPQHAKSPDALAGFL